MSSAPPSPPSPDVSSLWQLLVQGLSEAGISPLGVWTICAVFVSVIAFLLLRKTLDDQIRSMASQACEDVRLIMRSVPTFTDIEDIAAIQFYAMGHSLFVNNSQKNISDFNLKAFNCIKDHIRMNRKIQAWRSNHWISAIVGLSIIGLILAKMLQYSFGLDGVFLYIVPCISSAIVPILLWLFTIQYSYSMTSKTMLENELKQFRHEIQIADL